MTIFWSLVRWFANNFNSWLRHSWKSLANHLTRDQKMVIHGNSCIILYIMIGTAYHIWHKHFARLRQLSYIILGMNYKCEVNKNIFVRRMTSVSKITTRYFHKHRADCVPHAMYPLWIRNKDKNHSFSNQGPTLVNEIFMLWYFAAKLIIHEERRDFGQNIFFFFFFFGGGGGGGGGTNAILIFKVNSSLWRCHYRKPALFQAMYYTIYQSKRVADIIIFFAL